MELDTTARTKTDTHHRKALNIFGNDGINFDLQLKKWDVDTNELKEPETVRIFRAWVEPWGESIRKIPDPVAEARRIIRILFFMTLTITRHILSFIATWNNNVEEIADGGWWQDLQTNLFRNLMRQTLMSHTLLK